MKALMASLFAMALLAGATNPPTPSAADRARLIAQYDRMPLSFEENRGQTNLPVKFLSHGRGYALLLSPGEVVLRLARGGSQKVETVSMRFLNASGGQRIAGLDPQPGRINYLIGNDSRAWRTDVRTYARVEYRDLYPGIDLIYYGNQRQLEYDLVVAPKADPASIRLAFEGIESLRVDERGDLILRAESGEIRQSAPRIYQDVQGARKQLAGRYVMAGKREVGFQVDGYDSGKPLVIDPILSYSTMLGGGGDDDIWAVAVDPSGNAFVAGETRAATTTGSDAFPITAGPKALGGIDAFVSKFSPDGKTLLYSTFIGGNNDDEAFALAVDSGGNAYITGATLSTNFPTTNGFQTTYAGGADWGDAFFTKLNAAGNTILYSTYIGGEADETGNGIAIDSAGNAYIAGGTSSTGFPISSKSPFQTGATAYQSTIGGGKDAFVTKINPAVSGLASLLYSSYFGGSLDESAQAIAADSGGNAYITGWTISKNLPVSAKAYKSALTNAACTTSSTPTGPCNDTFVAKLNTTLAGTASLVYSTYLGGTGVQTAYAIGIDSAGDAYVAGETTSTDFPVTSGAVQSKGLGGTCNGAPCFDAFVTKMAPDGSSLLYSTYLGGTADDSAFAIAVDASGNAYVAGQTTSTDFPTSAGVLQGLGGGYDAWLVKLNPAASGSAALVSSTYLGGLYDDWANGVAVDSTGKAYVAGVTTTLNFPATNFPVTAGAYKTVFGTCDNPSGCDRSFVAAMTFSPEVPPAPYVYLNGYVNAASFLPAPAAPGDMVTIFGRGIGPATLTTLALDSSGNVASTLAQTQVTFDGVASPLIYVLAGQISAMVPFDVAGKQSTQMQVTYQGQKSNILVLPVLPFNLGIFTLNTAGTASGNGAGQGAILNQDNKVNTAANPAARGSVIQIYLTGTGQTIPAGVNGQIAKGPTYPKFAGTVTATIGGLPATVQYSGTAPFGVAGFSQINLTVPATAPTGAAVPVQINMVSPAFDDTTQDGLTVAIK